MRGPKKPDLCPTSLWEISSPPQKQYLADHIDEYADAIKIARAMRKKAFELDKLSTQYLYALFFNRLLEKDQDNAE